MDYINVEDKNGKRDILIDPTRSPYIVKILELHATGNYSMRKTKDEMDKVGLKSNIKTRTDGY